MKTIIITILSSSLAFGTYDIPNDSDIERCNAWIESLRPTQDSFAQICIENPDHPTNVKFREEIIPELIKSLDVLRTCIALNIVPKEAYRIQIKNDIFQLIASVGIIKENVLKQKINPCYIHNEQYLPGIIARVRLSDKDPYPSVYGTELGEAGLILDNEDEGEHKNENEGYFSSQLKEFKTNFLDVLASELEKYPEIKVKVDGFINGINLIDGIKSYPLERRLIELDESESLQEKISFVLDLERRLYGFTCLLNSIQRNSNKFEGEEKISSVLDKLNDLADDVNYFCKNIAHLNCKNSIDRAKKHITAIKEVLTEIENDKEINDLCTIQKMLHLVCDLPKSEDTEHSKDHSNFYLQSIYTESGIDYLRKTLFDSSFSRRMKMVLARSFYQDEQVYIVVKELQAKLNLIIKYSAFPISEENYLELFS